MSGPKDFKVTYSTASAAAIRRHNEQFRRQRMAHVQQKLVHARAAFEASLSQQRAERHSQIESELSERAKERAAALHRAQTVTRKVHEEKGVPLDSLTRPSVSAPDVEALELARQRQVQLQNEAAAALQGWSEALASDAAVTTFAAADLHGWRTRVQALKFDSTGDFAACVTALTDDAKRIHDDAGELQMKFDLRNKLLVDVIESMKEIGYFVSDPYLSDPADPSSSVVVKATCGSEVVTTSLELNSAVKSVWDGQEHEHCKETFFDFVEGMKNRGVEIIPDREDLRERPILKQKGANELPRRNPGQRQAGE